ncbi:MAG TPA: lanthionine synthetase C family protein [Pseudonocardiaceae bacterium]
MTTAIDAPDLTAIAEHYAARLARPEPPPADKPWAGQSLSIGAAGVALLHVERALAGTGSWRHAHQWIASAVAGTVSANDHTGLYLGAPAIAFLLDAAATGAPDRYRGALVVLDQHVAALAHRRVDTAMARIKAGQLPEFRDYDVFFGLTGIGALLLRRDPAGAAMERILDYLVALTRPRQVEGLRLPGWWVGHDPHRRMSAGYRGGHGNNGMAHGITGPLALLSLALRRGITVDGQQAAIATIGAWLDRWRQDGDTGVWWPEWITLPELRSGRPRQPGPARPSWCYGTPGIARAGQLAGIATGDTAQQRSYEQALLDCLDDPTQQHRITDAGLCHGWAGLYHTVWRAAPDAHTPALTARLPHLAATLAHHASRDHTTPRGFLDGTAGTALALHAAAHHTAPISGWDACLLIN